MGAAVTDLDDPMKVFGVFPSSMGPPLVYEDFKRPSESNISTIQEEVVDDEDEYHQNTIMTPIDSFQRNPMPSFVQTQKKGDLRTRGHASVAMESSQRKNASFATPVTPSTTKVAVTVMKEEQEDLSNEDYAHIHAMGDVHHSNGYSGTRFNLPAATLFQNDARYSSDLKLVSRSSGLGTKNSQILPPPTSSGATPSIIFNTPGLTPIPKTSNRMSIDPLQQLGQLDSNVLDSFTMGNISSIGLHTDSNVVSRAKSIADRMYYQPSPEITPPHAITKAPQTSMKLLRGKRSQSRYQVNVPNHSTEPNIPPSLEFCELMNEGMDSRYMASKEDDENNRKVKDDHAVIRSTFEAKSAVGTITSKPIPLIHEKFLPGDSSRDVGDSGVQQILELLCVLGTAHRYLCQYKCHEALQVFFSLNHSQYETGWVLHQVGRAYFELADYHNAQKTLESMEKVEPHRLVFHFYFMLTC
jgi:hypothetical protein